MDTQFTVRCEYDGSVMKIFVNDDLMASNLYNKGIFSSNADILIGSELYNNQPGSFAEMILKYVRVLSDSPPTTECLFYAYDFLSLIEFNYTTILSSDNLIGKYRTLILPYDDITTYEILTDAVADETKDTRNIVVLNTNGYGPLLSLFGNLSSDELSTDKILIENNFEMPFKAKVAQVEPSNGTVVSAWYSNLSQSSPLVMSISRDGLTLTYINIYPLLEQNELFNATILRNLTHFLSDKSEVDNQTAISRWFTEPSLLFTNISATGKVSIIPQSVALIKAQGKNTVYINSETSQRTISNVSNINIGECKLIEINSTRIVAQKGYGFYTNIIVQNPTISIHDGGNVSLILDGEKIEGKSFSMQINGNMTLMVRQPRISVDGSTKFENFYVMHPPIINTNGQATTIIGSLNFQLFVSDEFTIAIPYKFGSSVSVNYEKPLMSFDEIKSFLLAIPFVIVCASLLAVFLIISRIKIKSKPTNEDDSAN